LVEPPFASMGLRAREPIDRTLTIICQVNPMQPAFAWMKSKAGRLRFF
jgi:hypothetical protein